MKPNAVNIIRSYLSNRQQYVNVGDTKSTLGQINIGVPQGSILGPLLFLIYINDISLCSDILSSILYADDSTFSTCIDELGTENSINDILNSELQKVSDWLKANRLCLNASKTKFMLFDKTLKDTNIEISINNTRLEKVDEFNFLGLTINKDLDWTSHINALTTKLNRNIGIIRRLRYIDEVPFKILKTLYYALIHPHLTYMLLAWGYDCDSIELEQRKVIRIINGKHYLAHTDPLYKDSNILKLSDIHTQSQLKFSHKYIHAELPQYFMQLPLTKNNDQHTHYTRISDDIRTPKPDTEYSRKIIRHSLPKLINSLDDTEVDEMFSLSCSAFANSFKRSKLENYSNVRRCNVRDDCYPCKIVYGTSDST